MNSAGGELRDAVLLSFLPFIQTTSILQNTNTVMKQNMCLVGLTCDGHDILPLGTHVVCVVKDDQQL